ncbi:unnamed protein product [Ceratitis capitata]|uniref:(Mediterranean fruit fly) hypothetical protein n=1 Tax=Ceratitis capitata TaxID=7213 RepID=A0A811V1D7_CERCA|nr:unnamed protein product [Ceratitis capitata]
MVSTIPLQLLLPPPLYVGPPPSSPAPTGTITTQRQQIRNKKVLYGVQAAVEAAAATTTTMNAQTKLLLLVLWFSLTFTIVHVAVAIFIIISLLEKVRKEEYCENLSSTKWDGERASKALGPLIKPYFLKKELVVNPREGSGRIFSGVRRLKWDTNVKKRSSQLDLFGALCFKKRENVIYFQSSRELVIESGFINISDANVLLKEEYMSSSKICIKNSAG